VSEEGPLVTVYTDGACSGNPGPGGWAALLISENATRFLSGFSSRTTNNRMELQAAIEALKALKVSAIVQMHTDSTYVRDGIQKWIYSWQSKNWRTSSNKPVVNQDLWVELFQLVKSHQIVWKWVRSHGDDKYNNFVDLLARGAISRKSGIDVRLSVRELEDILNGRQVPWQD
jgi:ribonuclease HI